MSKINIQVHALPTEKAEDSIVLSNGKYWNFKGYFTQEYLKSQNKKSFHLYATTDETPKEGDWAINKFTNKLKQLDKDDLLVIDAWRKIVATDNKDLKITTSIGNQGTAMFNSYPPISPEFQQAWVREMNNGTPIVDAMMEMEQFYIKGNYHNKCSVCNKMFTDTDKLGFICSECGLQPKLNPQGYVTILPVKEKMYTKAEVIKKFEELSYEMAQRIIGNREFEYPEPIVPHEWAEKNL